MTSKKKEDLNDGDIIWNKKSKFDDDKESIHPNLVIDKDGYTMTSSPDLLGDTRVEYKGNDIKGNPPIGIMRTGKYVTKFKNELDEEEYGYIMSAKKSFVDKFKNWLNKK